MLPPLLALPSALAEDPSRLPLLAAVDLKLPAGDKLPDRLRQLEGKRVEMRGYMYAGSFFSRRFDRFAMTVETKEKPIALGFGSPLPLELCAVVKLKPGQEAAFTPKPQLVRGVLRVRPIADGDARLVLVIEDADVKTVSPRPDYHNSIEGGC